MDDAAAIHVISKRHELAAKVKEICRYAREASTDRNRISKEARASWYLSTRKRGRPTSDPDAPSDQG